MIKPIPTVEFAGLAGPGTVGAHNEDSHATDALAGFAILAHGMGGHHGCEVASELAVAQLSSRLRALQGGTLALDALRKLVEQVNAAIYYMARHREQCAGMGATLVAALFRPGTVLVAHVGDARLYRLRGASFEAIMPDAAGLSRGTQGHKPATRALGVDASVEVEVAVHATQPHDVYLLCSNGLNDMAGDAAIEQALRAHPVNLAACAVDLVELANRNGGPGNVTVILARVLAEPGETGMLARLSGWIGHAS